MPTFRENMRARAEEYVAVGAGKSGSASHDDGLPGWFAFGHKVRGVPGAYTDPETALSVAQEEEFMSVIESGIDQVDAKQEGGLRLMRRGDMLQDVGGRLFLVGHLLEESGREMVLKGEQKFVQGLDAEDELVARASRAAEEQKRFKWW